MNYSERRRYIRHETEIAVTIHRRGEQFPATMIGIGRGGIDLISEAFIFPGTELDITADYSEDYAIHGTVRWAQLTSLDSRGRFRLGAEADRVLVPEDILGAWFLESRKGFNPGSGPSMLKRPTYKELEHKIQTLEAEAVNRARVEAAQRQLNEKLKQRVAELADLTEEQLKQLQHLASELTLSEQRERRRMAELLHDDLQQLLLAAKFNCDALSTGLDAERRQAAGKIIDFITQSIQTARSLTAELSPPCLRQGRLSEALEWLASWMQQNHGLAVELKTDPGMDPKREDITVFLFQSIRELLLNVIKHAGVKSARVEIARDDENRLRASVMDAGTGFDPEAVWKNAQAASGFGLLNIRERLTLLGGSLEAESSPGNGASFSLIFPSAQWG